LGTSLGLALKGKCHRIAWARRKESLDYALKKNACDQACEKLSDAIKCADISVICLPVKTIISFTKENASFFAEGSIVTDIASVKREIVRKLNPELKKHGVDFVGSHPMAGSEHSGAEAAYPEIYRNAVVFLTPSKGTSKLAVSSVADLWKAAGAKIEILSPELHDKTVALTSHLVHLSAAALASSVLQCSNAEFSRRAKACAGGFRDSTRVASSSPDMWEEIIDFNSDNIVPALKKLEDILCEFRKSLKNRDLEKVSDMLRKSSELRKKWNATQH
ncbi:MAG TPA: prephenate dehydrogenase/arogenate dehydrogenase family protein, partial [Victivallales bacterium]|nr:prephenate dehydrogenase/arogenate dehydrogenase family protein [Victivallales bacterium]